MTAALNWLWGEPANTQFPTRLGRGCGGTRGIRRAFGVQGAGGKKPARICVHNEFHVAHAQLKGMQN